MTDIEQDHDADVEPGREEDPCEKRVDDLRAELTQALWEMGYFITMTCALGHFGTTGCDCDERIARINVRLEEIKAEKSGVAG